MVSVKSAVPALTRGIRILELLQTPATLEEIVRRTRIPKTSVLRMLMTLREEGFVLRDASAHTYQSAITMTRNPGLLEPQLLPGDAEWRRTPGNWYLFFSRNGIPCVTTYGGSGDSDTGIMWRSLTLDCGFNRIRFQVHGGHAHVYLVDGGEPIPIVGDMAEIHGKLVAGEYGKVLGVVAGPDSNETDTPVCWELTPRRGGEVKVVIIDSLKEPWGFVSVSRMVLQRV